jgi:hypothetical protein
MTQPITRRVFLGAIAGVGALAGPAASSAASAADTSTVYRLNPDWGSGAPGCVPNRGQSTCGGCSACVNHGANKLFATPAAADTGRAHAGCKCRVEAAWSISTADYGALFAGGTSADRRTPMVNQLFLRATASIPTRTEASPSAFGLTGASSGGIALTGAVGAALGVVLQRWFSPKSATPAEVQPD